jgi:hypothetical protein
MYQTPEGERPGCRETLILTRAVFAVILPALVAIFAVLFAAAFTVVLYARHPALALIPIAIVVTLLFLYARWERGRFRPPGL